MATDAVGNVNVAPGVTAERGPTTDLELLASTAGWTQQGVTLKTDQGTLAVGTPIEKDSSTAYYVKSATTSTTVEGFLRNQVDTGVAANGDLPKEGNIVLKGVLKYSLIKAANGATDLAAGAVTALAARKNLVRDLFIF